MKSFKPPENIFLTPCHSKSIFLAGTIDMGASEDWQSKVEKHFENTDYHIYNPRRVDWDKSWKEEVENPVFYEQVTWELNALENAEYIIMLFLPDSKSPISLLELGLYAQSKKIFVCCPKGFYKSGNIEIVCEYYNIPFYRTLGELLELF